MIKNKNKKIIPVDYGLSSSYDDFIEINRKLKGSLKKRILNHELSHNNGKYSWNDLKTDFNSPTPYFFESIRFCIKNPESFVNFFILMYSYYSKSWTINTSALIPIYYFGIIWILFWVFLFKVSVINVLIGYFCFYGILNIGFLLYTHYYVTTHKDKNS